MARTEGALLVLALLAAALSPVALADDYAVKTTKVVTTTVVVPADAAPDAAAAATSAALADAVPDATSDSTPADAVSTSAAVKPKSRQTVTRQTVDRQTVRTQLMQSRLRSVIHQYSPAFSAAFEGSRAERLVMYLLMKGGKRYTLFVPTDHALAKFAAAKPKAGCPEATLDDEMAHHVAAEYLDSKALRKLKPGTKIPTVGDVNLVVKSTKPFIVLEVRSPDNELVSVAQVTRVDRRSTSHSYVIHYIDRVLTSC